MTRMPEARSVDSLRDTTCLHANSLQEAIREGLRRVQCKRYPLRRVTHLCLQKEAGSPHPRRAGHHEATCVRYVHAISEALI